MTQKFEAIFSYLDILLEGYINIKNFFLVTFFDKKAQRDIKNKIAVESIKKNKNSKGMIYNLNSSRQTWSLAMQIFKHLPPSFCPQY